jgi:two-component system KDP operon response regulator KdpE
MTIAEGRPETEVDEASSGDDALERIAREPFELVLLDLAMPGRDGFSVLRQLRADGNDVPIIVVTARDLERDTVRALELGADDYVTKPFSPKELLARVEAVLRRARAAADVAGVTQTVGELTVDFATRHVTMSGHPLVLTPTEHSLLCHFVRNTGRVLSHRTLLKSVWGPEYRDQVQYLKVYVGRLRAKLEADAQRPLYIQTVRGVGYRFAPPTDTPPAGV